MKNDKEEKENRLLNTAFRLFTEKGIKETSIQEIVDNASVAKGTFYLYFRDKYEIRDILIQIQNTKRFSYDDLMLAYDMDMVNKELFPMVDDVKRKLEEQGYYIGDDEIQYLLDEKALESVNEKYDGKDLLKPVGGRLHFKSEDKRYRDERCMEIYGKMI